MEEDMQPQDDMMMEGTPETMPLEDHESKEDPREIHPTTSKWMWFGIVMLVVLISFGIAWYIMMQNDELTNEIESRHFPESETLTKRALKGIGKSLTEAKEVIKLNGEKELQKPSYIGMRDIYNQIEDWDSYSLIEEKENRQLLRGDSCGNDEQDTMVAQLEEGDVYELDWSGPTLMYVPNQNNVTNDDFLQWRVNCSAGGVFPLQAYEDKLLFMGTCSSGVLPEEGTEEFDEFTACVKADSVTKAFFMHE